MKKRCIAMLLAGGQGSRLYALTREGAKPNVSFGGKYRIIDFPLSNCAHSGIDVVGVLTQYQPLQLNSYIGNGGAWDISSAGGGVYILPPYQTSGEENNWFKVTADAIYQNRKFVDMFSPHYVLILSGDHVYKMDYSKMIREHELSGADCTIAAIQVPLSEAHRFGVMTLDVGGRVKKFSEKPKHPDSDLVSMGIYVFTWDKLRRYLKADEADPASENDFGKNIIPKMLASGEKLRTYLFEGYWRDVGTIDSLWEANMDLLGGGGMNLYDRRWPIWGNSPRTLPPQYIGPGADICNSMATAGCSLEGKVYNSVLSNSAIVERGASVRYSILMPGAVIKSRASVQYAIIGENATVCEGAFIGAAPGEDGKRRITTCGPGITVGEGVDIAAGEMLYEDVEGII